ncbi:ribosome maturation factor [Treponema sp.]|uniref:ribosome maturation factor n=1 Tax=Treponema sp. TaxID=166 RepID=UPI0025DE1290|nr:ribosome maturation factor [Treponema sp.]MCR5219307.1 ribosome maturation factor [Treponema sp.]
MEFNSPENNPYFKESAESVLSAGFVLVELQVAPKNGDFYVTAVISPADIKKDIGVADCSKVHHLLGPKILELLQRKYSSLTEDNLYMEVCSPGVDRNIKNAWEFTVFTGRKIRVWDKTVSDWVAGVLIEADDNHLTLESEDGSKKSVSYVDIAKAKFFNL